MHRLRFLAHEYLLPLVIGALLLRALIPAGLMPGGTAGLSLTATLCNASATGNPGTEVIEIPVGPPGMVGMHCDFCFVPVAGAAGPPPAFAPSPAIAFQVLPERANAPAPRFALLYAQIPRAPPVV